MARGQRWRRGAAWGAPLLALVAGAAWVYFRPGGARVAAVLETEPVHSARDAADDAALWVDRDAPAQSLLVATDKREGLLVYDLEGRERQRFDNGPQNNVDLRDGFALAGVATSLVAASATKARSVYLYRVDAPAHQLVPLPSSAFQVGLDPSGICLYRGRGARLYCFVNGEEPGGDGYSVEQWELRGAPDADAVAATLVRSWRVEGRVEGCACDDDLGFLYLSEERHAVWRYGAEPDAGQERIAVDRVFPFGHLRYDVEGIALYAPPERAGYLIVSSQGSNDFTVYDRRPPHTFRGRFGLRAGTVDAVSHTDGIEACSTPLGERFPEGVFVAQDDRNDDENQDFKLASWRDIAHALGLGR